MDKFRAPILLSDKSLSAADVELIAEKYNNSTEILEVKTTHGTFALSSIRHIRVLSRAHGFEGDFLLVDGDDDESVVKTMIGFSAQVEDGKLSSIKTNPNLKLHSSGEMAAGMYSSEDSFGVMELHTAAGAYDELTTQEMTSMSENTEQEIELDDVQQEMIQIGSSLQQDASVMDEVGQEMLNSINAQYET